MSEVTDIRVKDAQEISLVVISDLTGRQTIAVTSQDVFLTRGS